MSLSTAPVPTLASKRRRELLLLAAAGAGGLMLPGIARAADTNRYRLLHSFSNNVKPGAGGDQPNAGLIRASDGRLYGTAVFGGAHHVGTVYRMTSRTTTQTIYSFGSVPTDGARPHAELVQASDGLLYGTTYYGDLFGSPNGTIFRTTLDGDLETLHIFSRDGDDGVNSIAPLIQASNGDLYGTCTEGNAANTGTIFRLGMDGSYATLHAFDAGRDGSQPYAGLVQGADGLLYGTTSRGGPADMGSIFRVSMDGKFQVLHLFTGADGMSPQASLVVGADGAFYGTTELGGSHGDGTIFRIAADGTFTTRFSFDRNGPYGACPTTPLMLASDGQLYGTAGGLDGVVGVPTLYRMTPAGQVSVMHTFVNSAPAGALLEAEPGVLLGVVQVGGTYLEGAIYALSVQ